MPVILPPASGTAVFQPQPRRSPVALVIGIVAALGLVTVIALRWRGADAEPVLAASIDRGASSDSVVTPPTNRTYESAREVAPQKGRLVIRVEDPEATVLLIEDETGRTKRVRGPFPRAVDLPLRGWTLVGRREGRAEYRHRVDFEPRHLRQSVTIRF